MDFEDLLLKVLRLVEDPDGAAGRELRRKFDHVLVDEFQDTNLVQYRIVRALSASTRNLCVVGDDDQSIYRWRGADVRIIRGFRKDFPDAETFRKHLQSKADANASRLHDGITEALEYLATLPGVSAKTRRALLVLSDLEDNGSGPGSEQRLLRGLQEFGNRGGLAEALQGEDHLLDLGGVRRDLLLRLGPRPADRVGRALLQLL